MKKINWISSLIFIVGSMYFGPSSAVIIGFSPSSQAVNVGDEFNVDIVISDLFASDGSREIVSAFDLDVLYDSSLLNATTVTFGSSLGDPDPFLFEALFDSVLSLGRVDLAELSSLCAEEDLTDPFCSFGPFLVDLQPNASFTLATLSFEAISEGTSLLRFDALTIPGVDVKGLDPFTPFDLSSTTGQAEVTIVASVPEPGILLLMLTGIFGLGLTIRKNKC